MGELNDAIEADRRQAEWAATEANRQRDAVTAERRRAESLALSLVSEFIERAKRMGIEPDYEVTTCVRITQEHYRNGMSGGEIRYGTYELREKVIDPTIIDCWNLAPEGSGSYFLSVDGFHLVRRQEEGFRKKVPFTSRFRSHLTVSWERTPPSVNDTVYTESKRDEYYRTFELKQAMVNFFKRQQQ